MMKFPAFTALYHVSSVGNPAAAWRYLTDWGIDGRMYTLFVSSFGCLCLVVTVHNFASLLLCPLRTGGSLVMIVIVPGLWIVTPSSPGWKTVVYPSCDVFVDAHE